MKKILVLLVACAAIAGYAAAQDPYTAEKLPVAAGGIVIRDSGSPAPLILVDGTETALKSLVLHPNSILEINVLKDDAATSLYGIKAKYGAIIIKTKPGTEFRKATDFVDAQKNLNRSITKIELNGVLLPDMKKLLIEKTAFVNTMILSGSKVDENCNAVFADTLVISTRFADDK